jgi:hypothetical protein
MEPMIDRDSPSPSSRKVYLPRSLSYQHSLCYILQDDEDGVNSNEMVSCVAYLGLSSITCGFEDKHLFHRLRDLETHELSCFCCFCVMLLEAIWGSVGVG